MIKKKLQESILEVSEEQNANLNEEVKNVKRLNEGTSLLQKCENFLKGPNKKSLTLLESKASSSKDLMKRMNFLTALV